MVHVKNVLRAIKDGSFILKVAEKTSGKRVLAGNDIYRVCNRNIIHKINQVNVYNKYSKKYEDLIERFVVSEKSEASNIVWICWLQGIENAPDLVKACINSVYLNLKQNDIRLISESNLRDYISFPEYIEQKYRDGIIGKAHYSDLIRTELLCKYGGLWLDATVLCTSGEIPKTISDSELFVYQTLNLDRSDFLPILGSNWLIKANKNNPIMMLTRELLFRYWKDENQTADYFIFHILFSMAANKYKEDWEKIPVFSNQPPHVLQFEFDKEYSADRWIDILSMSKFHKLNHHINYDRSSNSFYNYVLQQYSPK